MTLLMWIGLVILAEVALGIMVGRCIWFGMGDCDV